MRDILSDLEAGNLLSDPDPVRRAQIQMKSALPKRFYNDVSTTAADGGFTVHLDSKPVRTPGKAMLVLPTEAAVALVANEFAAQGDTIDPITMPVLRLVNTAIDGVANDPQAVLEDVLRFASSDLLCYRAEGPQGLVQRENDQWNPVLDWAQATFGARFHLAEGVVHVGQPRESIVAIGAYLAQRTEPLRLAALHVMTALTGSALLSIAVEYGKVTAETAWSAAHVDEDWQIEQWGHDSEAVARRIARKRDFMGGVRLLGALDDTAR